ncbi:WD40-repeat-containing domain protein [Lentinula guzmanii]|uniref:WD40-repeat-containing domain protein n=1 Tax=Lentinula guzmanii TaxID=2804957 RepID=A0AA38JUX0_9AGAR|nr:WD40-repeat-containing domain protein [Lentinula guzmanii]
MKSERPDVFGPATLPKLPPPGASGPPLPSGPGQSSSGLPSSSSHSGPLPSHPPGPSSAGTSPMMDVHPPVNNGAVVPINTPGGGLPDESELATLPSEFKKEGTDWFVVYNSKVEKVLNVNLAHTLMHESVLVDESVGKSGDLFIRSVCFSPDGEYLATGAEDKQIRIWDIQRKKIRNIFDGHQQEICSLDFSADGRLIVSGSGDKTARIWDMVEGTSKVLTINDPDLLNNDAGVTSVAISPNGQYVAAGSLDTVVRIWEVATGMLVERLRGHTNGVHSVAFTPDGKGLVSGSLDKTLKYWDVGALMTGGSGSGSAVKGRNEGANGAGPNGPGGSMVKRDGENSKQSQCTMNFIGHKHYVLSVAVSHDGRWVVSGSRDRGVQFWDSKTAVVQSMLQGHKNSVISIDLSPTANILATGSGDWQLSTPFAAPQSLFYVLFFYMP